MRVINVQAFLDRDRLIKEGKPVDHVKNVLEFVDEKVEYAILSHRWMKDAEEVDYCEMVKLAKMSPGKREEIRHRDGYQKILQSCELAKDKYEWLWVDTCCIDKRSSAELSESINSMYRWYENAQVCYVYLHDVPGLSFPTASDSERYPDFRGWPEWFSRGWTLQELIAPSNLQFFNNNWRSIGYKKTLAPTLARITRIPEHILIHGLNGNHPCVAQMMSWAANRTTRRVEDRAYSLMGLLDVNMPMLYGEGKKAFHRLQLEIIRASNDQSIFAWYSTKKQPGSILADDPSDFSLCGEMELMGHDELIQSLEYVSEEELDSIEDRLGTFPITNRGIQIWLLLSPNTRSRTLTLFQALLPCRHGRGDPPVTIDLALWESNYYRCPCPSQGSGRPQLRQVYLRYQDPPHRNITFEVDDSTLTENGFTRCDEYPKKFSGNTLTLTSTDPLCVKVYFDSQANHRFLVGFGQWFGKDWIHVRSFESDIIRLPPWRDYTSNEYFEIFNGMPEHAQAMNKACSGAEGYGQICVMQTRLPQATRVLQISSVMWNSSGMRRVKLEAFHDPSLCDISGEWTAFDVDGTDDPGCDWRGLMILDRQTKCGSYEISGVRGNFWAASDDIQLGDYGDFTDSNEFSREGNLKSLSLHHDADITPVQLNISSMDRVTAWNLADDGDLNLYKPLMSLPRNDDLKSLLVSCSTRPTNKYLVTRIIQCLPDPVSHMTTSLLSVAKPFIWYQDESTSSVAEEWSGAELQGETKGDQNDESGPETVDDQAMQG